jgi:MFS family permease
MAVRTIGREAAGPGDPVTGASAPAGGVDSRRAWVVAVTVAVVVALAFGICYSFGAFFDSMEEEFHAGRSATATVFAITTFLFFGVGIVSGPLSDRIGLRRLLVAAAFVMSSGLLLTSRVHALWIGYLTYGVGVGFGAGLYVTPAFAVVGGWFERRRALALGIASAGSGMGTLVLVPSANQLIEHFGWRTAYVVLGCVAFVVLLVAALLVERPPVPPPRRGDGRLRRATGTRTFKLLFVAGMLMSVGLFAAFAFVVPFAKDQGISASSASLLISIVGAASVTGRLVLSSVSHRVGPLRLYQICLAVQPLAYLVWLLSAGRYGLLAVFAIILGASYGGYVALGPTVAADLFGVAGLGGLLGALYFGSALGGLVGPPIAGYLVDSTDRQVVPIALALGLTVAASAFAFAVRAGDTVPVREGTVEEVPSETT